MFNPFQIFDLPVDFQLDEKVLNARYLKLQRPYIQIILSQVVL